MLITFHQNCIKQNIGDTNVVTLTEIMKNGANTGKS